MLCISSTLSAQSVLESGDWFKFSIEKNGVYKISFDQLKKIGINPGNIDPLKIRIFGNAGGMLAQANNAPRPVDLTELAIDVTGADDGKFDKQDYILFYAEGADQIAFNPTKDLFYYQNNLYSDHNFYFLTIGADNGKRIQLSENLPATSSIVNQFDDYAYHEVNTYNDQQSGREWFGETFGATTDLVLKFPAKGIAPGSPIKIVSDVMGQSQQSSSFKLFLNDVQVAEQFVLPIPNSRYGIKGQQKRDTVSFNESDVTASLRDEQEIRYQFVKAGGVAKGYLNYVLLNYKRVLNLYDNQTIFTSGASVTNTSSTFEIGAAKEDMSIWDISDQSNIKSQSFDLVDGRAQFTNTTEVLKTYVAFTPQVTAPEFVSKIPNQNLHGLSTPNLIIVAHPDFVDEAKRLAEHRQSFSNWSVHVVTTEQIYHEYASGRQDVTAIRDFARDLHRKTPDVLKALLLFGKGSYDYKDVIPDNTNFVPTYESRNSLHPLQTYSSDDFFTFLEDNEGDWFESPAQNHTLDIGVGRLPVVNKEQAKDVVDKIIAYDSDKKSFGYWRKEIVFVADDGNGDDGFTTLHQSQADNLSLTIQSLQPAIDSRKIFMGTYPKTLRANGEIAPKMSDDIIRAFDRGALIINYTGHGSERAWADEDVLNDNLIDKLENKRYPFLITATCEFGRNDNPQVPSTAELCVTKKDAAAIGLVTTARPVNASTNFELNHAFYEALLQRDGNGYFSLGEVFRMTKNNSTSGVSNRNFTLLADPSLTLALPSNIVHVTSAKTASGSDTLKALSKVVVKGQIETAGGEMLSGFNGIVEATLFDKESDFVTQGRNSQPFKFKEWHTSLFRGKASVINGEFEFEFILPKNISYAIEEGKLSLYASDLTNTADANGYSQAFKIGGSETNQTADATPPSIELFMGDSTFLNGGITSPDTYLVGKLSDASGINISNYGIGNSLLGILDIDGETFILNDYYTAETDDYTTGWIRYPLKNLTPGKHTITVKAWDTYNNPAESKIDFIVTDGQSIVIESFGNYPNPFIEKSTLFFTHNSTGDDLEAHLFIYTPAGKLLKSLEIPIQDSEYRVNLYEMNNSENVDKKLPAGLYLARLIVRSLTNGSKNEQVTKLIILN